MYTYVVEVTEGKVFDLSSWTKTFSSTNAFKARTLALTWVKEYFIQQMELGKVDNPELLHILPPDEILNLRALGIIVYLIDKEMDDEYVIYGDETKNTGNRF